MNANSLMQMTPRCELGSLQFATQPGALCRWELVCF